MLAKSARCTWRHRTLKLHVKIKDRYSSSSHNSEHLKRVTEAETLWVVIVVPHVRVVQKHTNWRFVINFCETCHNVVGEQSNNLQTKTWALVKSFPRWAAITVDFVWDRSVKRANKPESGNRKTMAPGHQSTSSNSDDWSRIDSLTYFSTESVHSVKVYWPGNCEKCWEVVVLPCSHLYSYSFNHFVWKGQSLSASKRIWH